MPVYDRRCSTCQKEAIDCYETINSPNPVCSCGGQMVRVMLPSTRAVIGDEIDVEIKHGLCMPDGSPRRFRSRAELRRAEVQAGLVNRVEHVGAKGSDKSKFTSKWY